MAVIAQVHDATGNWNDTATWIGGVVPADGDTVLFYGGAVSIPVGYTTNRCAGITFTSGHTTVFTIAGVLVLSGQLLCDKDGSSVILDGAAEIHSDGSVATNMILIKYRTQFRTVNTDSTHMAKLYGETGGSVAVVLTFTSYNPHVELDWVEIYNETSSLVQWGQDQDFGIFRNCSFHNSAGGSSGALYGSSGIVYFENCIFYDLEAWEFFRSEVVCYNCSFGYMPNGDDDSSTTPKLGYDYQAGFDYVLSRLSYDAYQSPTNLAGDYSVRNKGVIIPVGLLTNIGPGTPSGCLISHVLHKVDSTTDTVDGDSQTVLTITPNSRFNNGGTGRYAEFPDIRYPATRAFLAKCEPAQSVVITVKAKRSAEMTSTSPYLIVDPQNTLGIYEELALDNTSYADFTLTKTAPAGCYGIPFVIRVTEYASGAILYIASVTTTSGNLSTELNISSLEFENTITSSGGGSPQIGSSLIRRIS